MFCFCFLGLSVPPTTAGYVRVKVRRIILVAGAWGMIPTRRGAAAPESECCSPQFIRYALSSHLKVMLGGGADGFMGKLVPLYAEISELSRGRVSPLDIHTAVKGKHVG